MAWRIGVDAGGTFTGLCLFEDETGEVEAWKVPAAPGDPARGIREAITAATARLNAVGRGTAEPPVIRTALSGPGSGLLAVRVLVAAGGLDRLICVDMGGSETSVALPEGTIFRIDAGGRSAVSLRSGGSLQVGQSEAGADPAPAGDAGAAATVDDAQVLLGTIGPRALLGGCLAVRQEPAAAVIGALAARLGTDPPSAAEAVVSAFVTGVATPIRRTAALHGQDLAACSLVASGGAGPLHAARLARELGVKRVLVPRHPGYLGAIGALLAERHAEFSAAGPMTLSEDALPAIAEFFGLLRHRAATWFADEKIPADTRHISRSVLLCHGGHSFEAWVGLSDGPISTATIRMLADGLAAADGRPRGGGPDPAALQVLAFRIEATGQLPGPCFPPLADAGPDASAAHIGRREVWMADAGGLTGCEVYDRERLAAGNVIPGPALIEEATATTLVPPGVVARVDPTLGLLLEPCA